jgi:hypothetical protein
MRSACVRARIHWLETSTNLDRLARVLARDGLSRRDALREVGRFTAAAAATSPLWAWTDAAGAHTKCKHVTCRGKCCKPGQHCAGSGKHKHCACAPHRKSCPKGCFDLKTDKHNCGKCGHACPQGEFCFNGTCSKPNGGCATGLTLCDGACVSLASNVSNCGACNHKCPSGEVCSHSACADECASGLIDCSGHCANLETEAANCGACGHMCAQGHTCTAGSCAGAVTCTGAEDCPAGQACNVNTRTCSTNCGQGTTRCNGGCCSSAGTCIAESSDATACAQTCPYGQPGDSGACVGSGDDVFYCVDCTAGDSDGPVCGAIGGGCGCATDAQCSGLCNGASNCTCDHSHTGTCRIPCTLQSDCSSGINADGFQCIAGFCGCESNSDCYSNDVCGQHGVCVNGGNCSDNCTSTQCCNHLICQSGTSDTSCGSPPNYCEDCTKSGQHCMFINNAAWECV